MLSQTSAFVSYSSEFRSVRFSANLSTSAVGRTSLSLPMASNSKLSNQIQNISLGLNDSELDRFADVGNKVADAAGEVIRGYFRKKFDILQKEDLSKLLIQKGVFVCLLRKVCEWKGTVYGFFWFDF